MPSKTLEDKVDDLTKLVAALEQKVHSVESQLPEIKAGRAELAREVGALGKLLPLLEHQIVELRGWKEGFGSVDQLKIDQALLRKEIDELRKWQDEVQKRKDESGRRVWALISSIIVALVGWALGYFSRPK